MMRDMIRLLAALALLVPALARGADEPSLAFGAGPGEVGVLTAAAHPGPLGIPLPMGPSALRFERDRLYLLDGVNRRLLRLEDGRPAVAVALSLEGTLPWLGDFALARGEDGRIRTVWVVDRLDAAVLAFDAAGRRVMKLGGSDDEASPLRDPRRIEVGASGRVYVADEGAARIFVFAPDGKLLKAHPTTSRGFLLDADETLRWLSWSEADGTTALVGESLDGRAVPPVKLPLVTQAMPELRARLASGTLVVTHPPSEPDAGPGQLAWCAPGSSACATLDLAGPEGMLRYLAPAGGEALWVAAGDLAAAPAGRFSLRRLDLSSSPEG